jgi:hypothetical protein
MKKPASKGNYVHVEGKTYDARTKKARVAIRQAGWSYAPITRWDGFEWHDTGTVLHPEEASTVEHVPKKKSSARIKREVDEILAKKTGSSAGPRILKILPGKSFADRRVFTVDVQYPGEELDSGLKKV